MIRNQTLLRFSRRYYNFSALASLYRKIELTPSRNDKTALFASVLPEMNLSEKQEYVKITLGLYQPRQTEDFELMIAESLTLQALLQSFPSHSESQAKQILREVGDYGDVAILMRGSEMPS